MLLTLPRSDNRRQVQGDSLLRRLKKYGIIDKEKNSLDHILSLKIQDFLERRLQTLVFKLGLCNSIHESRVWIRQRHIAINNRLVNIPSFMVRLDSENKISFFLKSPLGGGMPGRVRRKTLRNKLENSE